MQINHHTEALLDDAHAAKVLGIAAKTLPVWRSTRRVEIPYVKIGRLVRYRMADLQRFITEQTVGAAQP